jgi:hypothetical protein
MQIYELNFTILDVICGLPYLSYTFKYIFVYSFIGNHFKKFHKNPKYKLSYHHIYVDFDVK